MNKALATMALAGAVALGHAATGHAQATVNGNATITVPQVLYINVSNTNVTFQNPAAGDFNTGWIAADNTSSLEHAGNVAYDVTAKSATAFFDAADAANDNTKPDSDLELSLDGNTWTGLNTTDVLLLDAQGPGSSQGAAADEVSYRVLLDYGVDAPDNQYSLDFVYTIAAD